MLNKVDYLVEKLEEKEKEISAKKTIEGRSEEEVEIDEENLVTVQVSSFLITDFSVFYHKLMLHGKI
jgi:hypothetical protein